MGVYYVQQEHTHPIQPPKPKPIYYGNCYRWLESQVGDLPSMATLQKTATASIGNVAVFMYPNGIPHVAHVLSSTEHTVTLREANFHAGQVTERTILRSDSHIRGYYSTY